MKCKPTLPRRLYIRILSEYASREDFKPSEKSDKVLCAELMEEGYLSGSKGITYEEGLVIFEAAITVKGRLFLQQLEKEEKEQSLWGRSKRLVEFTIGVIVGVLIGVTTSIVSEIVRVLLHLKN